MKNPIKNAALLLLLAVGLTVSCKDKEANSETEFNEISADTVSPVEMTTPDTTNVQAAPLNDTNTSGVTSGKMEQVP